jgi:hypothetical protein
VAVGAKKMLKKKISCLLAVEANESVAVGGKLFTLMLRVLLGVRGLASSS